MIGGSEVLTVSFDLQQIMKDRWINAGFEEDELKPYTEPELDITDQKRIGGKSSSICSGSSRTRLLLRHSHVKAAASALRTKIRECF